MDKKKTIMSSTETEEEIPVVGYAYALKNDAFQRGYIKCRLIHLREGSFVMPDLLMVNGTHKNFFSPQFFTFSMPFTFGGDGSADMCHCYIDLIGNVRIKLVFFRRDLIKKCADHSFIYRCAFAPMDGKQMPIHQGKWRKRGKQFELALYHHTNTAGKTGIASSSKINGSAWNIQGSAKLENIAYGYFTSIPRIRNAFDLFEIGMSDGVKVGLLETNKPFDPAQAHKLDVYEETSENRKYPFQFWVDIEMIGHNHLWKHPPKGEGVYYERVLPKVFRIGLQLNHDILFKGMMLGLKPEACKRLDYVIVGNADTEEGLRAPFHEGETDSIGKVDNIIPNEMEIIVRSCENSLFNDIEVEFARLITNN